MLSIIVCSRSSDISQKLRDNVNQTIGDTRFDWVIVDNSKNQYNIFQAYNEGVRRSSGDILCFMHDDILLHSHNWGKYVLDCFETYPNLGCLGVAGGHLMLDTPSSFWHSEAVCMHYYGKDPNGDLLLIDDAKYRNPYGLTQVASVDGIWMCIGRSLFDTIRFDDSTFDGFHCYDSDICLQILQAGYDIGITFDILVEHGKSGHEDANYFKSIQAWHEKWHDFLPVARGVEFTEDDIALRTSFVTNIIALEKRCSELERVYLSKAYLLGKNLMRPLKRIKSK